MQIVLDTNILVNGCNLKNFECTVLLTLFYKNERLIVAFDSDNSQILREYRQNLCENEFYQKWYSALCQSSQVVYYSGKLNTRIKQELENRKFHELADQTFVAVALNADKVIITEDSDYGKGKEEKASTAQKQEVLRYMTVDLGLNVMDSNQALIFVKGI